MVTTIRTNRKGEPFLRSVFAKTFYGIMKKFDGINIKQGSQDFRMMTRQVVEAILDFQKAFLIGLVLILNILKLKI